jgi:EAL domain-containing protein (putative c-di-GMP-specific phosphodiesterase class I)
MRSSTSTNAMPRVSIRTLPGPRHGRYRGGPPGAGRSSPAGLHGRPWVARLRRALERDSFELHFQPIVSLRDGTISHYEALLRLIDESSGQLVAPGRFLPAAERYGLISEIDRMVLARVTRLLGVEPALQGATVAVNVSALSVTDGSMLTYIDRSLRRHRVEPSRLAVEITETAAI